MRMASTVMDPTWRCTNHVDAAPLDLENACVGLRPCRLGEARCSSAARRGSRSEEDRENIAVEVAAPAPTSFEVGVGEAFHLDRVLDAGLLVRGERERCTNGACVQVIGERRRGCAAAARLTRLAGPASEEERMTEPREDHHPDADVEINEKLVEDLEVKQDEEVTGGRAASSLPLGCGPR
ncbi:MAG: hypothetical protein ACRDL2_09835 [Gaiellaceae bacterium]